MNAIETIEDEQGYVIEIHLDDSPESPRAWDNVSVLAQLSRDYLQPDTTRCRVGYCTVNHGSDEVDLLIEAWERYGRDTEKVERYARAFLNAAAIDWWDDPTSSSRIVGIITREDAEHEGLSDPLATLNAEIQVYAAWANGEVYGWTVTAPDGEEIDACWGYYGWEETVAGSYMLQCAQEALDWHKAKAHAERAALYRGLVG